MDEARNLFQQDKNQSTNKQLEKEYRGNVILSKIKLKINTFIISKFTLLQKLRRKQLPPLTLNSSVT